MSLHVPRLIAIAPGGPEGVRIVIAACRAGALGVINLSDSNDWQHACKEVARFTDLPFAIQVAACDISRIEFARLPTSLAVVLGSGPEQDQWRDFVASVHGAGRIALLDVISRESGRFARAAGADGLIASGHEAGGDVSESSTLILLQELLADGPVRIWARGGIGPNIAAGCIAAGASGVVLDGVLLLAHESPIPNHFRERIARWDGSETRVNATSDGRRVRVFTTPEQTATDNSPLPFPCGQDSALAGALATTFVTVGGIVQEFKRAIDSGVSLAQQTQPLAEHSSLARSHKTRYPIVQGPMTRVSDTASFAEAVADGGALPFLALAMLRGPEVRALLEETSSRLKDKRWGVGVLGFVPPELRQEQIDAIREVHPPFALIAGGRPDQARHLEAGGIATYLHAPSPAILSQYLKDGARRFVFEGRECGGHVGPRSSFLLWEQAIGVVTEAIERGITAAELHLLFAGGIHDGRSAALVATATAPLAARGAKIGVLMGTAYLFTREAVSSGAIVPRFQEEAIRCQSTVLLETGPGHEIRISPSPFVGRFEEHRNTLIASGASLEQIRTELEGLNAGRLRIAAKGVDREDGPGSPFVSVDVAGQHDRGLYMLGQAATVRDQLTTIAELHHEVCDGATAHLREATITTEPKSRDARPSDVAIVGISAIFPGATDARTFWENTLSGRDTIVEVPPDRWDWRLYYDVDPKAPDKIISKWGGFLPDIVFDPLRYGMPPTSLPSIEPVQLLTLEAVRQALDDAGYADRPFPKEKTSVVLGIGGGAAQLAMGYALRSYLPMLDFVADDAGRQAMEQCGGLLPEWTEDSFPGFLLNVAAGRVANRFDLGGSNFTVDAACGSSLAAAYLAVRELETGASDVVILGGADTVQNPLTYLAFSKTQAFSPRGRCRPFDASADGIVISEGVAAVVLKRLADAERDGDRIYAVIKGIGSSSDGRARGLTAPRPEGQVLALKRAYEKSLVDPSTLGYIEAHGTGTAVGDVVEVAALSEVLAEASRDAVVCRWLGEILDRPYEMHRGDGRVD